LGISLVRVNFLWGNFLEEVPPHPFKNFLYIFIAKSVSFVCFIYTLAPTSVLVQLLFAKPYQNASVSYCIYKAYSSHQFYNKDYLKVLERGLGETSSKKFPPDNIPANEAFMKKFPSKTPEKSSQSVGFALDLTAEQEKDGEVDGGESGDGKIGEIPDKGRDRNTDADANGKRQQIAAAPDTAARQEG